MISFKQFRSLFLKTSLVVLLTTATTFNLVSANSWAATSTTSFISQPQTHIAMNKAEEITNDIKGKAQEAAGNISEAIDNIKGEPKEKNKIVAQAKKFNAKTLEGINNSIENPEYQPSGKTKQAEKEATEGTKEIKAEAVEAFK